VRLRAVGVYHDEVVMGLTADEFEELARPEHDGRLEE
jgi:hypothetical protein